MFDSHVATCIDWTSLNSIQSFWAKQSAPENNHLLCNKIVNQNSIKLIVDDLS